MKRMCIVLFLLPVMVWAQEAREVVKTGTPDEPQMTTGVVNLKATPEMRMDVSLQANGETFFLQLAGWGTGAATINTNDMAIFLLDNDSTVTLQSTTIQGIDYNNAVKTYRHQYLLRQPDLEGLSRHRVQAIRKYSVLGFDDITINSSEAAQLMALCASFLQKLQSAQLLKIKPSVVPPSFPGGKASWTSFLNQNLSGLPPLRAGEQKTAVVEFRVHSNGSISQLSIKQSAGAVFDGELLRVLQRMPVWKPATAGDQVTEAVVRQTIRFYQDGENLRVQL